MTITPQHMIIAVVIFTSSLTSGWSSRRRLVVFMCFAFFVLAACAICGHLAACRVAKILK
jgi:hypothetical protein